MEAASFSTPRVRENASGGFHVAHGDDAALLVQFYMHAVRQGFASEKAGRDIYKDEPYIWIRFPGDKTKEVRRPVNADGSNGQLPDSERFPKAWAAFQNQQEQVQEGTPLEQFPPLGRSSVLNFKAANIHTVEQLAAVSDSVIHNLGTGGMDLRQKARDWLKAAQDASIVTQLRDELKKRDDDIAGLRQQIAELAKRKKD